LERPETAFQTVEIAVDIAPGSEDQFSVERILVGNIR